MAWFSDSQWEGAPTRKPVLQSHEEKGTCFPNTRHSHAQAFLLAQVTNKVRGVRPGHSAILTLGDVPGHLFPVLGRAVSG